MKQIKIDLKKMATSSKQPKELSDALAGPKNGHQEGQCFTKTFAAPGGGGGKEIKGFTKTFAASGNGKLAIR